MEKLVEKLTQKYKASQPLVEHMEKTELRPADNYIVMAGHVLWDLWHSTRLDKYFYMATVFLENALKLSPSNWQLKFLLIR